MIDAVPFFRPSVGEREIEAVTQTLRSGWLTSGPAAKAFEEEFTEVLNAEAGPNPDPRPLHSIAVNSATAALHLGLEALGVGHGDEVLVPTLTFTATAEVVRYLRATPVLVDIDPDTFCIDLAAAEAAITKATKAIMPVHFAGRPCDMTGLRALADKHGLSILDDAAHALPASHSGEAIGTSLADVTAFSFYANKTMTTGEGGMLVTRDPKIADRARVMRLHGIDRDVFNRFSDKKASYYYDVVAPGFKYNLTDMAASMGRVQLERLEEFHTRRTELKDRYLELLSGLPLIMPPEAATGDVHSWHLFIIQLTDDAKISRDDLAKGLQEHNIGISLHYQPLHKMTYWASMTSGSFPAADAYFERCLTIPLFMDMRDEEQDYVVQVLKKLLG
ncbi:MAG: DegT/DnrJ/EryC1/StrS family aminotransferase [Erythrobacter sp.]